MSGLPLPEQPVVRRDRPLAGLGALAATSSHGGLPHLRSFLDFRPQKGLTARNWVEMPGQTDGVFPSALPRVGTLDGRPGLSLDGSAGVVRLSPFAGVTSAVPKLSFWARFVLRAEPATGASSGILNQWNNTASGTSSSYALQVFNLSVYNAVGTAPAHTLAASVVLASGNSDFVTADLQYDPADLGAVWTAVAVFDGSAARLYLFTPSGMRVSTTNSFGQANTYSGNINTSATGYCAVGMIDGHYTNMVALGAGCWPGLALTPEQAVAIHQRPWEFLTGRPLREDAITATRVWSLSTSTAAAPREVVNDTMACETAVSLSAVLGGSLTSGGGMAGTMAVTTTVASAQLYQASAPTLVAYSTVTAAGDSYSVKAPVAFTTVTGVRVGAEAYTDGRRDLLGGRRYRR